MFWIRTQAMVDGYEKEVCVNAAHIRYCLPADADGESTRCVFAEDETLVVHVPFATMQEALLHITGGAS